MKKWKTFVSGMFAMAMVLALTGTAFAAAGKLQVSTAGIVVLDQVRIEPGTEYTANGSKIPAVVTYQDAAGKTYSYLPAQMLPDLLNVTTSWSESRNSVVLGPTSEGVVYSEDNPDNPLTHKNPTTPVTGRTKGPFTEIDPKKVDTSNKPVGIVHDGTKVQTVTCFDTSSYFIPKSGKYIVLKVTNNGSVPVTCYAARSMPLGGNESLGAVDIGPGKTLTRAFSIVDGVDSIHGTFVCGVRPADRGEANVTVSLKQYK